ncbi:hypothetical protein QVZ41_06970 [Wenyingzhuangia sp. chi5]|uniref:Carboxypeptidase-like protein n=2 Tax=Wenyingzhuangia gilva TaxID=3057677 RepID=A0ABT8VRI6_9FLAO|nr:hypothetical protein [Wenyingzhuangia sp. chi5]
MFILVVSTVSSSFSQEIKLLKGLVVNDSIDVVDVTVTNKNLKQSTKTNNSGIFELPVRLGDSLMVSAIHINKISLLITQEIIEKEVIEIEVEENVNNMEEVVLNNMLGTSALDFNVGPTTNPDPEKLERIKLQHLTNTDPTRTFQGGNILGLFSLVSKLFKNKNGKKHLSKQEKRVRFEKFKVNFSKEFGTSFFTDDLNISEFQIDEFISYCNKKQSLYDMYSKDEKLELIDFLIKQSKEYKKEMNIEN